jgi:hypothetical protein
VLVEEINHFFKVCGGGVCWCSVVRQLLVCIHFERLLLLKHYSAVHFHSKGLPHRHLHENEERRVFRVDIGYGVDQDKFCSMLCFIFANQHFSGVCPGVPKELPRQESITSTSVGPNQSQTASTWLLLSETAQVPFNVHSNRFWQ